MRPIAKDGRGVYKNAQWQAISVATLKKGGFMMNQRVWAVLMAGLMVGACASSNPNPLKGRETVRICTEDHGCGDFSRDTRLVQEQVDPAEERNQARIDALSMKAEQDPRAAFDLGLRFFRGDGIRRDAYQSMVWMKSAAERGHAPAQLALGRFYLSGLEEMGPDPAAAESWLSAAAGQGNAEAKKLLAEARKAKQDEIAYRRWVDAHRSVWLGYWWHGYNYLLYWRAGAWYFY